MSFRRHAWRWTVAAVLASASLGFAQQRTDVTPESKWEVLEGCRLITNSVVDGDSFRVMHNGRAYIFRLYFVDAPETDSTLRDRIIDQAAYFGISPADIPKAGALASQFTHSRLERADFRIITRWNNAMGRSSLARFYGIVFVNGKNLAEELVGQGLARIYGPRANWQDGPRSSTFINQLKNMEMRAREQKLGIWNSTEFPPAGSAKTDEHATTVIAPAYLDLNAASFEELQRLPGIGPKLAERIIAHRPYEKMDELNNVPGIGEKTIQKLRPLVKVVGKTFPP